MSEKIKAIEIKVFGGCEESLEMETEEMESAIEEGRSKDTFDDNEKLNCDLCDFVGKSSKGLKIHKGRKHGEMISCDVCQNIFESKRDYKVHQLSHSSNSKFKTTRFEKQVCQKCN